MAKKSETKPIGEVDAVDVAFRKVVEAFARDSRVTVDQGKGFGKGALKIHGKIFAMISSKRDFVVKLPAKRQHRRRQLLRPRARKSDETVGCAPTGKDLMG